MSATLPTQTFTNKEKTESWKKQCVDAIIELSEFSEDDGAGFLSRSDYVPYSNTAVGYRGMQQKAYLMYNGILDDADYSHVMQPYGNQTQSDVKFPARLYNYNIIKPLVDLLIGEYLKRPHSPTVTVANPDVVTLRDQAVQAELAENLKDHFLKYIAELGFPVEAPEDVPPPELVEQAARTSYRDTRADIGQKAINYLRYHQDLDRKRSEGFFHWLVAGEVFTKTSVFKNETVKDVLNPLDVDYDKSPDTVFVEDGEWAIHRALMYPSDIVNQLSGLLTKQEITDLEAEQNNNNVGKSAPNTYSNTNIDDRENALSTLTTVFYVYWRSKKRTGIVTQYDETGIAIAEYEVEDGYTINKDFESVEWFWENEVWQGIKIGKNIYKEIKPLEIQRNSLNNESDVKLPINGKRFSDVNAPNVSFVMMLMPYQLIHNVYKFRLSRAAAKAKDVIMQMDMGMIPEGWKPEDFLWWIENTGIAWRYIKEGQILDPQHSAVLDLTLKGYEAYLALIQDNRQEVEELTGITRQRKGQITQNDLKGTTQQSIFQSSTITEKLFIEYSWFEEKDYQATIDYSKAAWIGNFYGQYVMPDGTVDFLEVDGIQYAEINFGIKVKVNGREVQALDELKQLAIPMVQNGAPVSSVLDIFLSDSMSSMRDKIARVEKEQAEREQQMQQLEQQMAAQAQEIEAAKLEQEERQNIRDNETKILVAEISASARQQGLDNDDDNNGVPDQNQMLIKAGIDQDKLRLEMTKLGQKDKTEKAERDLKLKMHKDKMVREDKKIKKMGAKPATKK